MVKSIKSWGLLLATCQKESPGFKIFFKILTFPQFSKKMLKNWANIKIMKPLFNSSLKFKHVLPFLKNAKKLGKY